MEAKDTVDLDMTEEYTKGLQTQADPRISTGFVQGPGLKLKLTFFPECTYFKKCK